MSLLRHGVPSFGYRSTGQETRVVCYALLRTTEDVFVLIRQIHHDDACDFSRHIRLTRVTADVTLHNLEYVLGGHVSKRVQDR